MHHYCSILIAILLSESGVTATEDVTFRYEAVMGTSCELTVRAKDAASARWAEGRVFQEIDRLSAILSGYDPSSEFRRWADAPGRGPVRISSELFAALQACDHWHAASGGAFDARIRALSALWSDSARAGREPTPAELAAARASMARTAWRLDAATRTAERLTDCPLTLDAITKNTIIEQACDAALDPARGVSGVLLNVGGDLRVRGELVAKVGVAPPAADSETSEPLTLVAVRDRSIATSGASQRAFRIGARSYSHIFDPRSGRPARRVRGATVIARHSADANALATILNVVPAAEGLRLVQSVPGAACLIVQADGRQVRSEGWSEYERLATLARAEEPKPNATPKLAAEPGWGDAFELVVDFEINSPEGAGRRYRRPYVIVWAEDKNGVQVRTVLMWVSLGGSGPERWLPDVKRWYRSDQKRREDPKEKDFVYTVARATRPPGKYKAVWDGKDNQGRSLPPGEYTVHVEAAREHGTYQIIRKTVTLAEKPFAEDLKGNVEIRAASLTYRRKDPAKP
jgi:thiamine biosynthesis lipoprotein ApbE